MYSQNRTSQTWPSQRCARDVCVESANSPLKGALHGPFTNSRWLDWWRFKTTVTRWQRSIIYVCRPHGRYRLVKTLLCPNLAIEWNEKRTREGVDNLATGHFTNALGSPHRNDLIRNHNRWGEPLTCIIWASSGMWWNMWGVSQLTWTCKPLAGPRIIEDLLKSKKLIR